MHDLHEANKIIKLVLEKAQENKLEKVSRIVVELGEVVEHGQAISPDNLKFNMALICEKTVADGAEIVVRKSEEDHWKLVEIEG